MNYMSINKRKGSIQSWSWLKPRKCSMCLQSLDNTVSMLQRRFLDKFSQRFSICMLSLSVIEILNQTIYSVRRMDRLWKSLTLMCPNLEELDQIVQLRTLHQNQLIITRVKSSHLHHQTAKLSYKILKKHLQ